MTPRGSSVAGLRLDARLASNEAMRGHTSLGGLSQPILARPPRGALPRSSTGV